MATDKQACIQTDRQTGIQTDRQTGIQTDRQTDRQTDNGYDLVTYISKKYYTFDVRVETSFINSNPGQSNWSHSDEYNSTQLYTL